MRQLLAFLLVMALVWTGSIAGTATAAAWTGGKARPQWINTTGEPSSNPCNAQGAHGFFRQDSPAMAAIISFIRSR